MPECVLDASAVLVFLRREPGADVVERHLRGSCLSAVSLPEVLQFVQQRERGVERVQALLKNWKVELVPFEARHAELVARIRALIGDAEISFTERACLALAEFRSLPVLTANRKWLSLPLEQEVILLQGSAK